MGNCSSTTKPQKTNEPTPIKQIHVESLKQKSSDDSHSTQNGRTELMCSTPEIEEIIHSIDEIHSVRRPSASQLSQIQHNNSHPLLSPSRAKSPLEIDVNPSPPETENSATQPPYRGPDAQGPNPSVNVPSRPLTDAESLERINRLFNGPPTPQQLIAIQRIQRLARNKSAWRLAEAERDWKVPPPLSLPHTFLSPRYLTILTLKMRPTC
jgi:hypothetical protein